MDIKVLYINADGLQEEHSEASDSVRLLSLKTANFELTDAKLGNLVDGADANDEHVHDGRYFREDEHIATTAGAADAGKPVITDANGSLNNFVDVSGLSIDHGDLTGLLDDDHTQYILVDGTRAFTGDQSMGGFKLTNLADPAVNTDAVNLQTLQNYLEGLKPKEAVRVASTANVSIATAPAAIDGVTLASGDRVLLKDQTAPAENGIYDFNGAGGAMTRSADFDSLTPIDEINGAYTAVQEGADNAGKKFVQSGTVATLGTDPINFVFFNSADQITASTGLVRSGDDIQIDPSAAGAGLGFAAGVLSANVDDATIEIDTDTLRVKADGINDTHIDFGTGVNQVSGEDIPLADAGNYFAIDNVEAALQELGMKVEDAGIDYTVGAGGVSIGNPVYISSANTVLPYTNIAVSNRVIGVALTTEAAAGTVRVLANDTRVSGLTIAGSPVAGDPIYWDGTQLTATLPGASGSNVWQIGVLAETGDMHVEVRFVKKNA